MILESEEVAYECGARQKYPILFEEPVPIQASRWYVAWARVSGPSSDCGSSGQSIVTSADDGIVFNFKSSKKSNNGTDVNAGQLPQLLYKVMTTETQRSMKRFEQMEPISVLTPTFASKVSPDCFKAILDLIRWSWSAIKAGLRELFDCDSKSEQAVLLDLYRVTFLIRASLRLLVKFTDEVYPSKISNPKKLVHESTKLAEAVYESKGLLQKILMDDLPNLRKDSKFSLSHQRAGLKMLNQVLTDFQK